MPAPIPTPAPDEYAAFYATYTSHVAGRDVSAILESQPAELRRLIAPLSEEDGAARYEPGKWSVKQVLGHIADTERVMSFRMLWVARGDTAPLPGFEQEDFVATANSDARALASLVSELEAVRAATLSLTGALGEEAWGRRGTASGQVVSARALAHIIAGHWAHHEIILRERYRLGAK